MAHDVIGKEEISKAISSGKKKLGIITLGSSKETASCRLW
jgi:hypothetical protein